ncbi:MAG: Uma2 family endonuclease, partial [Saprospiraceae bacterium]
AVPEFVAEIRSQSDRLITLRDKMREYLENGVLLAWLIDVPEQRVEIYRAGGEVTVVEGFDSKLTGETILPGFEFDLMWMK